MRNWQNILFDLDGTLTDSAKGITASVRYALQQLEHPVPPQAVLNSFVGPPLARQFTAVCGFEEEKSMRAVDLFRVYFAETGITQNAPFPGIQEMLARLVQAGKRLHIATSKPLYLARQVLDMFDLLPYFTTLVGSPAEHAGWEKPEIVREALQKGGIHPQTAVMVGDRLYDVQGAHANALPCVGVLFGYGGKQELSAAGCDYLVESVEALEELLLAN